MQDLDHKIYLLHFSIDNDRRQENIVVKALIKENVIEKIASCELDFMSWSDMELDLFNLTKVLCCTKIQMCGCKV